MKLRQICYSEEFQYKSYWPMVTGGHDGALKEKPSDAGQQGVSDPYRFYRKTGLGKIKAEIQGCFRFPQCCKEGRR